MQVSVQMGLHWYWTGTELGKSIFEKNSVIIQKNFCDELRPFHQILCGSMYLLPDIVWEDDICYLLLCGMMHLLPDIAWDNIFVT